MQPDLFKLEPPAFTGSAHFLRLRLDATGECVVIAVVGRLESGERFARAVTSRILNCLPQELAYACYSFGNILVDDYLSSKAGGDWHPPLTGIEISLPFQVEADDKDGVVVAALERCALFKPSASSNAETRRTPDTLPRPADESRFVHAVKLEVVNSRPKLESGFNRPFSLTGASSGFSIDYCGRSYATCYAAINPKGRSPIRLRTASAALWRLARARDAFGFATPECVELTAWIPAPGLPIYRESEYVALEEAVAELREQARREQLQVFTANDSLAASHRLIHEESALN